MVEMYEVEHDILVRAILEYLNASDSGVRVCNRFLFLGLYGFPPALNAMRYADVACLFKFLALRVY